MKNRINSLLSKAVAVSMLAMSVMTFVPAHAAAITQAKDVMSRQKAGVATTHALSFTVPGGVRSGVMVISFSDVTNITASTDQILSCGGSGTLALRDASNDKVRLTETGCTGAYVVKTFNSTNPSAGNHTVTITSSNGDTVILTFATISNDQVEVTASVATAMAFVVGAQTAACATNDNTYGGTVALGELTTSSVNLSDVSGVKHICLNVSSNATYGYKVSVASAKGHLGSTSYPFDTIPSSTLSPGAMSAGTARYGICFKNGSGGHQVTVPDGANPHGVAPFNSAYCEGGQTDQVGTLTLAPQDIMTSEPNGQGSHAVTHAFGTLLVEAAISSTTAAHIDYTDTLTFVATGTFYTT